VEVGDNDLKLYFCLMTPEELQEYFQSRDLPQSLEIQQDMQVFDVERFISTSFIHVGLWKKDLSKCPSWVRLLKFKEALENSEKA
jgi:hypothetical protein